MTFYTEMHCREMNKAGINWGAFRDRTGMHMNAHANNLVLINEEYATNHELKTFLGPLDFDMAYTKDSCAFGTYGCCFPMYIILLY